MNIAILRAGNLTSVQDTGRFGYRAVGVGVSGALDNFSARVANLLVGNDESAAVLETGPGNFRIQFEDDRFLAWCGGSFVATIGEHTVPPGRSRLISSGQEFALKNPAEGCRAWVAISGGIDVPKILGSRSTDLRGKFGGFEGRILRDGDLVPLGLSTNKRRTGFARLQTEAADWYAARPWANPSADHSPLRILPGADWSLFEQSAQRALISEPFFLTPEADRMGAHLRGPELRRRDAKELLSEAVAAGTIQVAANGQPILLLGDCQTIGGYPKIAQVITVDLSRAAQLRPSDEVRFEEITLAEAQSLLVRRERDFAFFRANMRERFA